MKQACIQWQSRAIVAPLLALFSFFISSFNSNKFVEDQNFDAGVLVVSTAGGGVTVHAGAGAYSHTETGAPCNEDDGLSATSNNNPACTDTHDAGNYTGYATTIG